MLRGFEGWLGLTEGQDGGFSGWSVEEEKAK